MKNWLRSLIVVSGLLPLFGNIEEARADTHNHRGGWGWESYFMSYPFSYGGYWGAHYGGIRGIMSGASPVYGNYGSWYSRHYVIGTTPWPAYDGAWNRTWDERYNPSPWNYNGVSQLIFHPRDDVNVYVPDGAGTIAEAHNLHLEMQVHVPSDARVFLNGNETTSTGRVRRFVTEAVEGDSLFPFDLRVVVERNGREIEQTRQVRVIPGQPETVRFEFATHRTQQ